MNPRSIFFVLGKMLTYFSVIIIVPLIYAFFDSSSDVTPFIMTIFFSLGIGFSFQLLTRRVADISLKDGFLIVALGWLLYSVIGSIPYLFAGTFSNFGDAFFETMSGLTTTGATVMTQIEGTPNAILLWRSITQYIGGIGIIVLAISVLPEIGLGAVRLFNSEMPGPTKEKVLPRIKDTAKIIWLIYIAITALQVLLLKLTGLSLFDAINHSFTTMSTGGFSTKNLSIISFHNPAAEWIIILFMFIAGLNLTLHINFLRTRKFNYLHNSELKLYIAIILVAWAFVMFNVQYHLGGNFLENIRLAGFQIMSIITTTGFASANYELWPHFSQFLLVFLMFFGAMAGSTSGSVKMGRILVMGKSLSKEITKVLHPKMIYKIKINKQAVPENIIKNISIFIFLYFLIFIVSSLILTLYNIDIITSTSAVAACLGNVGPGLGLVGALDNYAGLPMSVKYFLAFLMMVGRLEIYTVIIILTPKFWKK
ncbi:MAG: TrkH family potassium uptake protein [Candidatus Margulisbacteria bacterium]|nr:TrkH family potassium uptake protein [Candidatus Margulisiibacteriota bacterium]